MYYQGPLKSQEEATTLSPSLSDGYVILNLYGIVLFPGGNPVFALYIALRVFENELKQSFLHEVTAPSSSQCLTVSSEQ